MKAGRVALASWAGAELPLALDLVAGNDDPRPPAAGLLDRALGMLPSAVCARPRVRADSGYFDGALAHAARTAGADYAIAAKRNRAAWRAYAAIPEHAWRPARDMHDAQVAGCDYTPEGWPEGSYTIVRRVRVPADQISADPRARRRRTIGKDQLRLALEGELDHAWAVSFIVTDIPADEADFVGLEAWFRSRVSIEERFREAKLGAGCNHLPSADHTVNTVWAWAGALAGALNVMLATLTGPQPYVRHPSRVHIEVLRRNLLTVQPGSFATPAGSSCDQDPAASTSPPPSTSCATCQHRSTDRARTPRPPTTRKTPETPTPRRSGSHAPSQTTTNDLHRYARSRVTRGIGSDLPVEDRGEYEWILKWPYPMNSHNAHLEETG